jgi:hypothetical protein
MGPQLGRFGTNVAKEGKIAFLTYVVAAGAFAALSETVVFLNQFKDLPDPRQPGKVIYPLA